MATDAALVSVTIVTYNNELSIGKCLDSVFAQDWPRLDVIVVDNDSRDATRAILSAYQQRCRLVFNKENRGFAAGQNQAIRMARGGWVLVLNPDVLLQPGFISQLVEAGRTDPRIGTVCGKLLRALPDLSIAPSPELDSTGMYFTPTFRHLDRGQHAPDAPEYGVPAYVFGATGAAALYRRAMIDDVSIQGEFYDEDFFFSREDADLSWRAQLLGWTCLYTPRAIAYHVRRVFPGVRHLLPDSINQHSVKNRFLMRIKNATAGLYLRNFLPVTARDLGIIAYCLVRERRSLPALWFPVRHWSRTWAKRRAIHSRRRVSEAYMRQWFRHHPAAFPAPVTLPLPLAAPPPVLQARATGSQPGTAP
jgi:GT2 family glycosyltransferase